MHEKQFQQCSNILLVQEACHKSGIPVVLISMTLALHRLHSIGKANLN